MSVSILSCSDGYQGLQLRIKSSLDDESVRSWDEAVFFTGSLTVLFSHAPRIYINEHLDHIHFFYLESFEVSRMILTFTNE